MELQIGGILLVPIIAGILELAKRGGLETKWVPWLNVALSVTAYTLVQLVAARPEWQEPAVIILQGVMIALAAAGFYSTTRYYNGKRIAAKLTAEDAENAKKVK